MILFPKIDISDSSTRERVAMFLLAAYPILEYYKLLSTPFSYATFLGTVLFFITIILHPNLINCPKTYLLFWAYAAIQIYFVAGIDGWSDYLPGGITLVIFSLSMLGFVASFRLKTLYYFLTRIWGFAAILFFIQLIIFYITGQKISVFLPLAPETTYCGFTYAELVFRHQQMADSVIQRFCSFFCEPSYFAQYSLILLVIELFWSKNRYVVFTKYSLILVLVIVLIQSGVGLLGLGIVGVMKLIDLVFVTKQKKYYILLAVLVPLTVFGISSFLDSNSGSYVAGRISELTTMDGSNESSVRIYYGWFLLDSFSPEQKLFGTSRNYIHDLVDDVFINGAQTVVGTMGWVAVLLLLLFYILNIRGKGHIPIIIGILLLYVFLIESIYLTGFMLLCTVIIIGIKPQKYSTIKI